MSDSTQPITPPPPANAPPTTGGQSGTVWKVLTALFAAAAVGLGIWAFTLNSDAQSSEDAATGEIATLQAENATLTEQVATLEATNATLEQEKADAE
jgi:uncharacterized protein HemX